MKNKNKRNKAKNKGNYIFPNILAKTMAKIDLRTQYEASMMSMTMILAGILCSAIYFTFWIDSLATWYKIVLNINAVAAFVFLTSFLVTTFQQYKAYLEAVSFQESLKGGN